VVDPEPTPAPAVADGGSPVTKDRKKKAGKKDDARGKTDDDAKGRKKGRKGKK
jgi:hypothetical protein